YDAQGMLNRKWLSEQVFNDSDKLQQLNAIVHPIVIQDAVDWSQRQTFPYSLKEAALLYESGSYETVDFTRLVVAPQELRVARAMAGDGVSREDVLARMHKQMTDEEKKKYASFTTVTDGNQSVIPHIYTTPQRLINIHGK